MLASVVPFTLLRLFPPVLSLAPITTSDCLLVPLRRYSPLWAVFVTFWLLFLLFVFLLVFLRQQDVPLRLENEKDKREDCEEIEAKDGNVQLTRQPLVHHIDDQVGNDPGDIPEP